MNKLFLGYCKKTSEEIQSMWGNCEFFLYTNILLQFYRLSEQSARQLLDILQTIM